MLHAAHAMVDAIEPILQNRLNGIDHGVIGMKHLQAYLNGVTLRIRNMAW